MCVGAGDFDDGGGCDSDGSLTIRLPPEGASPRHTTSSGEVGCSGGLQGPGDNR